MGPLSLHACQSHPPQTEYIFLYLCPSVAACCRGTEPTLTIPFCCLTPRPRLPLPLVYPAPSNGKRLRLSHVALHILGLLSAEVLVVPSALTKQECPPVPINTWDEEAVFSEASPDSLWLHSTGALGSLCVYMCLLDCEELGLAAISLAQCLAKKRHPQCLGNEWSQVVGCGAGSAATVTSLLT